MAPGTSRTEAGDGADQLPGRGRSDRSAAESAGAAPLGTKRRHDEDGADGGRGRRSTTGTARTIAGRDRQLGEDSVEDGTAAGTTQTGRGVAACGVGEGRHDLGWGRSDEF